MKKLELNKEKEISSETYRKRFNDYNRDILF